MLTYKIALEDAVEPHLYILIIQFYFGYYINPKNDDGSDPTNPFDVY